jgi:hypothetical protein
LPQAPFPTSDASPEADRPLGASALRDGAVADRFRHFSILIIFAAASIAVALDAAYRVRISLSGFAMVGLALAGLLYLSRKWWEREGMTRACDALGTVAVMTIGGLCCGAIAMLELRLGFPTADGLLHRADLALGIDGVQVATELARHDLFYQLLAPIYNFTLELFLVSLVVLSLKNDRVEAWRAAFGFVGTLLTTCIVAAFIPAKGLVNWASPMLMDHLPTSFLAHFNEFYFGADPVLRLQVIDGVITFPSFHAVVGFLVFSMWRTRRMARIAAGIWLVLELLSTVAGGHYLIDLIGGFGIWAASFALSRSIERRAAASNIAEIAAQPA